jgi:hypothetical protein
MRGMLKSSLPTAIAIAVITVSLTAHAGEREARAHISRLPDPTLTAGSRMSHGATAASLAGLLLLGGLIICWRIWQQRRAGYSRYIARPSGGTWLERANAFLPVWAVTAFLTYHILQFPLMLLIVSNPVGHALFATIAEFALLVIAPTALVIFLGRRYGFVPRAVDPEKLPRYFIGHGLIAVTSTAIVGFYVGPFLASAIAHNPNLQLGIWFALFPMAAAMFTYPLGLTLIWTAKET